MQYAYTATTESSSVIANSATGFSSGLSQIDDTNYAVSTDLKNNQYSIIDLAKGKLLKTYKLNVPIKDVIITNKVNLFD